MSLSTSEYRCVNRVERNPPLQGGEYVTVQMGVLCGNPARFLVKFPSPKNYEMWMCADCYDAAVNYWRQHVDVEHCAKALALNGESFK